MGSEIPHDHFKPYAPNPNTKLGRAYLYAVKESEGPLSVTEANFLRDNPLLWLRAISLYSANMDFLIRQTNSRLKGLAPQPGEVQSAAYLKEVRDKKRWSMVQEHKLQKIRARRAELIVELGYSKLTDATIVGDLVGVLSDLLAALRQEDYLEAGRLAEHWIYRLTGQDVSDSEGVEPEVAEVNPLQDLLSKVRKGRNATQD